jgi:small subunit ribosomal protein S20
MANTKQSAKRSKQEAKRYERNKINRSSAKNAVKKAIDAVQEFKANKLNLDALKASYTLAIKSLDKTATKGAIPKARASRKISRLTLFVKKAAPQLFNTK